MVFDDGGSEQDVAPRIKTARSTFAALSRIWKCTYLNTTFKLRLFYANIHHVLLYWSSIKKVILTLLKSSKPLSKLLCVVSSRNAILILFTHRRCNYKAKGAMDRSHIKQGLQLLAVPCSGQDGRRVGRRRST